MLLLILRDTPCLCIVFIPLAHLSPDPPPPLLVLEKPLTLIESAVPVHRLYVPRSTQWVIVAIKMESQIFTLADVLFKMITGDQASSCFTTLYTTDYKCTIR